jgi:hypothetical protein
MSDLVFHTIKITGALIFESKHSNFRKAISEYLSQSDQGGVQLKLTDLHGAERGTEDVVVDMTLVKMRQHPTDHQYRKRQITQKVEPKKEFIVKQTDNGAVDACFY